MIILFEENEKLFQSLGLGILKDAKSCTVKEGLNDNFELELQYPLTGLNFDKITLNRIIFAKSNPYSEAQPFRIYSISKPIKGTITVKAFHISYDMNGIIVPPISGGTPSIVLDRIQNGAIINHSFKFYTDITESKSFKTSNYYNMRAVLMGSDESITETYKGELLFDKFNVHVLKRRGSNKGASVRYSKNMKDLTHEVNYERLYNGVYPFYHKEEVEVATETSSDGFKQVYIVGTKPYQDGWFSYSAGGEPYHPVDESPVQVASDGDYKDKVFAWNTATQRYTEKIYNEMVNLIEYVTDLIKPSDKPSWIYVDVSSLPSIVVKANVDGYFKLATEQEWSKKSKGEIVFQGSIVNATDGIIMYYSEVIPSEETSVETESTNITHVELDDKIIWLKTDAALDMKYDRVLCLDLTSEFDDTPDKEKLETKAKEYIEENKIGQYKYDTKVSFIDLSSTTEGTIYDKLETIELGDTVKVVYEALNVNVELRVISTTYNVLLNRYDDIELGEKPEKISSSSVQTGDNVSSLTNDVGYADTTTVNKLIAKSITADLIQAKNAKLSKAQIEELQSARIKVTGLIEATQFELDTLVAKMLTADNAVIKQTLEAGVVKVKGDITVTRGSISIESTESGTVFNVDRDGNVTANSVNITGGELNINDTFTVTPDGILTAIGAEIRGRIEAESGSIANFIIESIDTVDGTYNRLYSGNPGYSSSVLVSPGYHAIISNLDNNDNTKDTHNWVFLAGNQFGVDDQGNLYAKNATIYGQIEAESGHIGGFTIASNKLYSDYVEISPTHILYGQNDEFEVKSDGTLKIQNANQFNISYWSTVLAIQYNSALIYYPGDYCIFTNELYICKEQTVTGAFNALYWTRLNVSEYNNHSFYAVGDYCKYNNTYYQCISPVGYQYIELNSNGLTASAIYVENANIHLGHIGGFTIGETALYKDISSFDDEGVNTGVYLGPDGLRIGKNLKIFPDGRIMSGSRNYDENTIYDPGDYCIQQGTLFRCITRTTGGVFDPSKWEEVSNILFGIDDVGRLTASSAEIVGNITAESGYIGKPGEGFTITSKAIYNGFSNPDNSATDTGVYLGTDGLRLGKMVANQFSVNFDNLTDVNYPIASIYNQNTNYIGSEFILSYDPKPYDRYITIREKENPSDPDTNPTDYIHINNPKAISIQGKVRETNEKIFNISDTDYIYISINDSSLWTEESIFRGINGLKLYFDQISELTYVDIEYFDSEEDWLNSNNPHTRTSGRIYIGSNYTSITISLATTDSPWLRFKVYSGQSTLTNCKLIQDTPKIVLLPANSSEISFTPVKYNNIKLHYDHGDQPASGTYEVENIALTLKVLPGFYVTPDGFMHAYNAKIYGSLYGDVQIIGGSISIGSNNNNLIQYLTDSKMEEHAVALPIWETNKVYASADSCYLLYFINGEIVSGGRYRCITNHKSSSANRPGLGRDWSSYWTLEVSYSDMPRYDPDSSYAKWINIIYKDSVWYTLNEYVIAYHLTLESTKDICVILGIESTDDKSTNIDNIVAKIPSVGYRPLTQQQLIETYNICGMEYKSTVFNVDTDGKITATAGSIAGYDIDENSIHKGNIGTVNSVWMSIGKTATISNLDSSQKTWAFTANNTFGVTTSGELYAIAGKIGNLGIYEHSVGYNFDSTDPYSGTVVITDDGHILAQNYLVPATGRISLQYSITQISNRVVRDGYIDGYGIHQIYNDSQYAINNQARLNLSEVLGYAAGSSPYVGVKILWDIFPNSGGGGRNSYSRDYSYYFDEILAVFANYKTDDTVYTNQSIHVNWNGTVATVKWNNDTMGSQRSDVSVLVIGYKKI